MKLLEQQVAATKEAKDAERGSQWKDIPTPSEWDEIELDAGALPEITLTEDVMTKEAPILDRAYQLLEQVRWVANVQITFQLLDLRLVDVKQMIGEQWQLVYPADPTEDSMVHPQILLLLSVSLERIRQKYLSVRNAAERNQTLQSAQDTLRKKRRKGVDVNDLIIGNTFGWIDEPSWC